MTAVDVTRTSTPDEPVRSRRPPGEAAVVGLTLVALIGLHFQLVRVGGYPVTLLLVLLPVLVAAQVRLQWRRPVVLTVSLAAGYTAAVALLDDTNDDVEFFRSYPVALLSIATILALACCPLRARASGSRPYVVVMAVVGVMSWLQWITGRAGNDTFFNPWRDHQYLYEYDPHLGLIPVRAAAFYLEPSFAALVLVACFTCGLLAGASPVLVSVLGYSAMVPVGSASGMLTLMALHLCLVFGSRGSRVRASHWFYRVLAALGLVFAATRFYPYLQARLASISEVGSSTNYRLLAPREVILDVLAESPFGRPLGSVNSVIQDADLVNGALRGTSLDNGWYLIVYYTGWVGLALLVGSVVFGIFRWSARPSGGQGRSAAVLVALCLVPFFTGAVLTPEVAYLLGLIILEARRRDGGSHVPEAETAVTSPERPEPAEPILVPSHRAEPAE